MNKTVYSLGVLLFLLSLSGTLPAYSSSQTGTWWAARGSSLEVAGSQANHLRAQAIDSNVIHLWIEPALDFRRMHSNALMRAATVVGPMKVTESAASLLIKTSSLQVKIDRSTLKFTITPSGSTLPIMDSAGVSWNNNGGWSLGYALHQDEHLLGLGQDNLNGGRLDRRGTVRDLWTGQQINSGNVTANYPVPLLLSTGPEGHAYGVFVDNTHRLRFDLGAADKNRLRCDAEGGAADFYVINGPTLKQVVERYTSLTGRPPLPPLWTLGYWQSKCVFYNWNDIDDATRQLTAHGFPFDVMVIDYSWPEFLNDFVWDKRWFINGLTPDQRVAAYAKQGVKIVMSNSGPMVVKDAPTFLPGWKAGVFATDGHGHPVEAGYYNGELLDFTSPAMDNWLQPQVAPLIKSGVAGWWLDLSEPEGDAPQTVFQGGSRAEIHNQYSLFETRWFENAQLKVHPNIRPWVLTRCGSAGIQRYHTSFWTGDTHSDFATLRAHPAEMLNSGLSGLTYWTSDSGGFLEGFYKNDQYGAHARLYERWMQFSVFSPITRAHHVGPVMPFEFGLTTEQGCLHYLQMRYRMLPYIYSYAWEANQTGLPITRPLALEYPRDPGSVNAYGDEYLFGRELLVAPVLHDGVTRRSVYFPKGKWIDWDSGYEYDGGKTWVVSAPQSRIPVAARAGAIIPMAPLMRNTSEKPWDPITVEVFPSGTSTFTMYKDDGKSFAYRKGDSTITHFTCTQAPTTVKLAIAESNKRYAPHQYIVRFHLGQTPQTIIVDGVRFNRLGSEDALKPMQWAWDSGSRILAVRFASGTLRNHAVVVQLTPQLLPRRIAPLLKPEAIVADDDTTVKASLSNFYPPTRLPNTVKAANYDKGGEGNAYHISANITAKSAYRLDNAGLRESDDAGGGFALADLNKGDWLRYTIDAGQGGYFDLVARVKAPTPGPLFNLLANNTDVIAAVNAPQGNSTWQNIVAHNVYLNPGECTLLLSSLGAGYQINFLDFRRAQQPPSVYAAILARSAGPLARGSASENGKDVSVMQNVGRKETRLELGVFASITGPIKVTLHYGQWGKNPVALIVSTPRGEAPVSLIPSGEWNSWKDVAVTVPMQAGMNILTIKAADNNSEDARLQSVRIGS